MNSIQGKGKRQKASQSRTVKSQQNKQPKTKSVVKTVLETIGGAAGNLVGLKDIGKDAGSWISKVTGFGDYTVNSNVFAKSSDSVPTFEFGKDGSVIVTHREMIQDIIGSTGFSSRYFDVHPLNPVLFPWLSIEALGYEQYEFLGLLFCYNSTCGDAFSSTNNSAGTVIMTTEYDVARPPFLTKSDMESYMFTSAKKPNVSFIHPVECNPKMDILNARYNQGYFRTQSASTVISPVSFTSNVAENLQCLGRLQLSTVGMQAAATVGELWVTYKVRLSKARAPPSGFSGGYFHASSNNVGVITSGLGPFVSPTIMSDSTLYTDTIGITGSTVTLSGLRPLTKVILLYKAESTAGTSPDFAVGADTPVGVQNYVEVLSSSNMEFGAGTSKYCRHRCFYIGENPYATPPTYTLPDPTINGSGATFKWDLEVFLLPLDKTAVPTAILSTFEKQERLQALTELYHTLIKCEVRKVEEEKKE